MDDLHMVGVQESRRMSSHEASSREAPMAGEVQSELLAMLQRNASAGEFDEFRRRLEATVSDPAQRSLLAGSIGAAVSV